jgi:hypothetical protein
MDVPNESSCLGIHAHADFTFMPKQKAGKFGRALSAKALAFHYTHLFQYCAIVTREQRLTLVSTFHASRGADLLAFRLSWSCSSKLLVATIALISATFFLHSLCASLQTAPSGQPGSCFS